MICHSVGRSAGARQHRGAEPRRVAPRQLRERDVVVHVLERRQPGQDHVGVPRGLVEVDVDADHQRQLVRAPRRAAARWAPTAPGWSPTVISALTCPAPGVAISSARQPIGNSPNTSGARDTRLGAPPDRDALAAARRAGRVGGERRRLREHRAARLVEVAGQHVDHVDQPARSVPYSCVQVPIRPYTAARSVAASWCASAADRRRVDPAARRHPLGRELRHRRLQRRQPLDVRRHPPQLHPPVREQRLDRSPAAGTHRRPAG